MTDYDIEALYDDDEMIDQIRKSDRSMYYQRVRRPLHHRPGLQVMLAVAKFLLCLLFVAILSILFLSALAD